MMQFRAAIFKAKISFFRGCPPKRQKLKLSIVSLHRAEYFWYMLRVGILAITLCWLAGAVSANAAGGRVIKVLPHLLDAKGRNSITPSLYDRDAYQVFLRQHPDARSGIRFDIQWKSKSPVWEPLKLRVEMRGTAHGEKTPQLLLEAAVEPSGCFSKWESLSITGDKYKELGDVTAWRATLWEGDQLLDEQKSFLW